MTLSAICLGAVLACLGLATISVAAAPGDLDAGFGTAGTTTTDVGPGFTALEPAYQPITPGVHGLVVQGDGKIVAAGPDSQLVRYNRDGSLDMTFDGDGRVQTVIQGRSLALQSDGKLVIAGNVPAQGLFSTPSNFAVSRYNPDGSLDTGFGDGGTVVTEIRNNIPLVEPLARSSVNRVVIQPDGKVVVAGDATQGQPGPPDTRNRVIAVARYSADGRLDRTFSADGIALVSVDEDSFGEGLALQKDGKIVLVSGRGSPAAFYVARLLAAGPSAGSLDPSFGASGSLSTDFGARNATATDVVVQGDKIVAVGSAGDGVDADFALARYLEDGSLDSTFGGDGKVTTDIGGGSDVANGVAVQDDGTGKLVAAGRSASRFPPPSSSSPGAPSDFAVVRYGEDGSLDASFSADGMLTTSIRPGFDIAYGVAVQPDDARIVVAGSTTNNNFALARYHAVSANLALAASASPDPVAVGASLTYTLTAANRGPDSSTAANAAS